MKELWVLYDEVFQLWWQLWRYIQRQRWCGSTWYSNCFDQVQHCGMYLQANWCTSHSSQAPRKFAKQLILLVCMKWLRALPWGWESWRTIRTAAHGSRTILWCTDAAQLEERNIAVTDEEKAAFVEKVYRPYLQSVTDHINGRMESTGLVSSMSVLTHAIFLMKKKVCLIMAWRRWNTHKVLRHYAKSPTQSNGRFIKTWHWAWWNRIRVEAFQQVIFVKHKGSSLQQVLSQLLGSSDIAGAFPNLAKLTWKSYPWQQPLLGAPSEVWR